MIVSVALNKAREIALLTDIASYHRTPLSLCFTVHMEEGDLIRWFREHDMNPYVMNAPGMKWYEIR